MNDEFDLNSLSLEDSLHTPNYFRRQLAMKRLNQEHETSPPPVFASFSNDEDDSMDIDEDFSMKEEASVAYEDEVESANEDKEENEEEVEADTSTSSIIVHNILSPTSLGARLAIRKPRLLLMGPEDVTESEHTTADHTIDVTMDDIEEDDEDNVLDTAIHGTILNRDRKYNFNQFGGNSSGSNRLEYYYNPEKQSYEAYSAPLSPPLQPAEPFAFAPGPFGGIRNSAPVQIHHHHYYGNSNVGKPDERTESSVNAAKTSSQIVPVKAENVMLGNDNDETKQLQLQLQYQQQQQQLEVALPLPWERRLVPRDHLPYVILSYLQLAMNVTFALYGMHLVYGMVSSIKQDIGERLKRHRTNVLVEIASCRRSWHENQCEPDTIVPALEQACQYWLKCMQQDVDGGIGQISAISAETIGLVLNLFVEPLGLKFYGVMLLIGLVMFGCNIGFGFIRAKTYYGWESQQNK